MLVLIKLMLFLSVSGPQTCSDLVSFVGFAAYCHRVQPCSRKTHSTNYHSIKRWHTRLDTNAKCDCEKL